MPLYEYECEHCMNHQEEFHRMMESPPVKCHKCGRPCRKVPCYGQNIVYKRDWSDENNGKGRYCGQLADGLNDPKAYCKSRQDLIDKAHARGFETRSME